MMPLEGRHVTAALTLVWVLCCCACAPLDAPDVHGDEIDESYHVGRSASALTLADLAGMHGCSTQGVQALSEQLLSGMFCLAPNALVRFSHPNITLTSDRVNPYLAPEGVSAILRVAERRELRINSALRTLAEQYVLKQTCSVAADPGRSNHETGRAIDVANWSEALADLTDEGFTHPLPGSDDVHFEYGGTDLRSISVRAFQRLWNANHPEDLIAEDGDIGPETNARLAQAPAEGFAFEAPCVCLIGCDDAGAPDASISDAGVEGSVADDAGADAGVASQPATPGGCSCAAAGARRGGREPLHLLLLFAVLFGVRARSRRRYAILLSSAALIAACSKSSEDAGPNTFAHCMSESTLGNTSAAIGAIRLVIDDGVLTISGARTPIRIAAFSGPGAHGASIAASLSRVATTAPTVVFILGGLGDDIESAKRHIAALAALRVPVLFVAGGRDESGVVDDAFESLSGDAEERVLDASRLHKIVIGDAVFIPIAGAPSGRYARSNDACGYAQSDLDKRDDAIGRAGSEHRYLLSWAAPTSTALRSAATGLEGKDAGDPMLARFAARVGASGGLFAWPVESAMLPTPGDSARVLSRGEASRAFRMVVPPIGEVGTMREDGSRVAPGFALVQVAQGGLSFSGP
ncbi:MAG: hypothetical protein IPK60_19930 [Sandaracinaceae bacterium]|nr:hypothetical protein [Sandaracinaceae bacterium]